MQSSNYIFSVADEVNALFSAQSRLGLDETPPALACRGTSESHSAFIGSPSVAKRIGRANLFAFITLDEGSVERRLPFTVSRGEKSSTEDAAQHFRCP